MVPTPQLISWQLNRLASEFKMHLKKRAVNTYRSCKGWQHAELDLLCCVQVNSSCNVMLRKMPKTVICGPWDPGELRTQVLINLMEVAVKFDIMFWTLISGRSLLLNEPFFNLHVRYGNSVMWRHYIDCSEAWSKRFWFSLVLCIQIIEQVFTVLVALSFAHACILYWLAAIVIVSMHKHILEAIVNVVSQCELPNCIDVDWRYHDAF